MMGKTTVSYDSPVEALIAIVRRLIAYEAKYRMPSESFFARYSKGELADTAEHVEWSNDYRHYIQLKVELEEKEDKDLLLIGRLF